MAPVPALDLTPSLRGSFILGCCSKLTLAPTHHATTLFKVIAIVVDHKGIMAEMGCANRLHTFVLGSDLPSSDHDAAFIGIWRQCVILRLTHVTLLVNRIKQNVDGFARRLDLSLRPSQLALCRN